MKISEDSIRMLLMDSSVPFSTRVWIASDAISHLERSVAAMYCHRLARQCGRDEAQADHLFAELLRNRQETVRATVAHWSLAVPEDLALHEILRIIQRQDAMIAAAP